MSRSGARMNLTPTSEPLQQPLEFAPGELLACGLRDAHTHPLVGVRTDDGVWSGRTSPDRAWAFPLVEWVRTGNSFAAVGFDCDSREAVERAAASCMGGGDLPTPNVYATRTASRHVQTFYLLDKPVHRGEHARAKPLAYLGLVSEYYRASLGADPGYRGVLASNPVHDDYQTSYPRTEPYTLDQLAGAIPKGWRIPHVPNARRMIGSERRIWTPPTRRDCSAWNGFMRPFAGAWLRRRSTAQLDTRPRTQATSASASVEEDSRGGSFSSTVETSSRMV